MEPGQVDQAIKGRVVHAPRRPLASAAESETPISGSTQRTKATPATGPINSPLRASVMAEMAPEGSKFDAKHYDSKMQELLSTGETEEFFTSNDEVFESFNDMGLQENLLMCFDPSIELN
ncbi:hypothetical protein SETIT_7G313400v2 [Setaria italica]|uniref:Uncharacterized protein n=1 Tax=Setaria italica TaxID=4555 RepID=A0A368S1W2_SETIT|nr:hypothetical protein SETIT_7G313400v2 [Setaria italica]